MKARINQESLTDFTCPLVTRLQRSVYHYPLVGRLAGWSFAFTITTTMNIGALIGIIENIALGILNSIISPFNESAKRDLKINLINLKDFGLFILTSGVLFITTTQTFWKQKEKEKQLMGQCEWQPIHFAASYDDVKQLKKILEQNSSVLDIQNQKLETPLFIAVKKLNIASTKFLLSQNANVNISNREGKTPLSIAQENKQDKMVKLLKSHKAKTNN